MNWKQPVSVEKDGIKLPSVWLYTHYLEAYNVLFRVENALRVFVYIILKKELREKWTDVQIATDESGDHVTIATVARKRLAQAANYGYLCLPTSCPILHLTSGELIRVIVSDSYWKYFNKYFRAGKEIVKTKLDEIGCVRNALAHFRPLKPADVDLLKQNAAHLLLPIESLLEQLHFMQDTVPTNSSSDWYKELKPLGTEICTLSLQQTKSQSWVGIRIYFQCPVVENKLYGLTFIWRKLLSIRTDRILVKYPGLAKNVIFATENIPYREYTPEKDVSFGKVFTFGVSRDSLEKNFIEIKKDIESLLLHINSECELLLKDNLAAGEIIESVSVTINKSDKAWVISNEALACVVTEDSPAEYWGDVSFYGSNYVSSTNRYPWMPVNICDNDPFDF
jgi:hypothetical protein